MTLSTVFLVILCLVLLAGLVILYRRQGAPAVLPQPVKVKPQRVVREVVSDLDALVAEPIAFRFNGEVHEIKPVSTLELLSFTNAFAELQELNGRSDAITVGELVDAYTSVISSVCPSITRDHVESMTQAQVAALFQLVMDSVVGKAHAQPGIAGSEDAKKKL